jgi:hypothetical protein
MLQAVSKTLFVILLLVAACANSPRKKEPMHNAKAVPNQLIVGFANHNAAAKRQALWTKHKVTELEKVGSMEIYLVGVDSKSNFIEIQKALSKEPGVKYAEPNSVMSISGPKSR